MATVTLQYNAHNGLAQSILDVIRCAGVFKVIDDSNPNPSGDPYFLNPDGAGTQFTIDNLQFVKMAQVHKKTCAISMQ